MYSFRALPFARLKPIATIITGDAFLCRTGLVSPFHGSCSMRNHKLLLLSSTHPHRFASILRSERTIDGLKTRGISVQQVSFYSNDFSSNVFRRALHVYGKMKSSSMNVQGRKSLHITASSLNIPLFSCHSKNSAVSLNCVRYYASSPDPPPPASSASAPASGTGTAKAKGIQSDISPLTTRRIVRVKRSQDATPKDQEVYDATAYSTAEEYVLETLKDNLEHQGLYVTAPLPEDVSKDALHVEARFRIDTVPREILFFRKGTVVFWNVPPDERSEILRFLKPHQEGSYDDLLIVEEYEQMIFSHVDGPSRLFRDEFQLHRPLLDNWSDVEEHQMDKFAFSNALALAVKLSVWEASLGKYVESIEWVLQDLKEGKKIRMSQGDVLRKTGELFTLRHLINLSSDLLGTPDVYWNREKQGHLYTRTCNYLNVSRRTKVMNEKLNHCCELAQLLIEHLRDKHHTRLELMIIWLIMIEVFFEVYRVIEKHYGL